MPFVRWKKLNENMFRSSPALAYFRRIRQPPRLKRSKYKASRSKHLPVIPSFCCNDDAVLRKFGAQWMSWVLSASMATRRLASKNRCITELVRFLFCNSMTAVTSVKAGHFLCLILESNQRGTGSSFVNVTTLTILEVYSFSVRCSSMFKEML